MCWGEGQDIAGFGAGKCGFSVVLPEAHSGSFCGGTGVAGGWRQESCWRLWLSLRQMRSEEMRSAEILDEGSSCGEEEEGLAGKGAGRCHGLEPGSRLDEELHETREEIDVGKRCWIWSESLWLSQWDQMLVPS